MRKSREPRARRARHPREKATRVRVGPYVFAVKGISRFDLRDPYHLAVALTWPQFLVGLFATYLLVNFVFATLFWLVPGAVANARPHNFADVLFFSIETLATVGYGEMYPSSLYGHVFAALEIMCGVTFTAILTGLTFVRFSRPRAKLIFAPNPVVAVHKGKPTLMLRIANGRPNMLLDATAKLNVIVSNTTAEGKRVRRVQEVRLERAHAPVFPFAWTIMHVLDERSPLHGFNDATAIGLQVQVFVIVEARDPTLASLVHDLRLYQPEDFRFGMRYVDAVATGDDGMSIVDAMKIGAIEPDSGERLEEGWIEREELLD